MYCCTCKARAVSGHSEAGARNAEKDGGFTYAHAANRNPVPGKRGGAENERKMWVSGVIVTLFLPNNYPGNTSGEKVL